MKLTEAIHSAKRPLFSFELLPPVKGRGIESLYAAIDPLMEFGPAFIDVTYHREEYVMRERPDGSYNRISIRKRPGTVAICAAIKNKYQVETVPHLICGGFTKDETENALIDLHFLGIENVLALRGDNRKGDKTFVPEKEGNKNSLDLIYQIDNMNKGIYLDLELSNPTPTNFCIGAAAYPEKHIDAPNQQSDLNFLKRKVEAGASFLTTQMFFDTEKYLSFVRKCRDMGIDVPIIPGIKPLTRKSQLYSLPQTFNIDIPEDLCTEVERARNDDEVKEIGIEWCVEQCKRLIAEGAPVLHFYTMGQSDTVKRIASQLF
ncbi:MAG: methylenetetrahydrofolate reductase [NAD(P)H] [Flavobacteriales bacterium]|nr:methylenetetrahydrofolate reductase [NAD(P)H] [Flavobacteriales bacterium]